MFMQNRCSASKEVAMNLVRGSAIVLGVGLVVLWLVGLTRGATAWLTWCQLLVAIGSFAYATLPAMRTRGFGLGGPAFMAITLFVLWMVGLGAGAVSWLCWWTFGFACAYLGVGFLAGSEHIDTRISSPRMA
jgi:hypothetical protein